MAKASQEAYIIQTHDLDFGELLALSGSTVPSVVIFRDPHDDSDTACYPDCSSNIIAHSTGGLSNQHSSRHTHNFSDGIGYRDKSRASTAD